MSPSRYPHPDSLLEHRCRPGRETQRHADPGRHDQRRDWRPAFRTSAPRDEILADYPYLEDEDITAVLEFAADRTTILFSGAPNRPTGTPLPSLFTAEIASCDTSLRAALAMLDSLTAPARQRRLRQLRHTQTPERVH